MTLRDLSPNGRVAAVTYDSHDPIDRTLASLRHQPEQQPVPGPDPDPGPRRAGRGHPGQHRHPAGQPDRQDHRRRAAGTCPRRRGPVPVVGPEPVVRRGRAGRQADRGPAAAVRQPGPGERGPAGPGDPGPVATTRRRRPSACTSPGRASGRSRSGTWSRTRSGRPATGWSWARTTSQEAVPAGLGGGREPDRRGLARGHDGPGQRAADLVQDGPVQPPVRRPADRRARAVRQPPAADLQRGHGRKQPAMSPAERRRHATAPAARRRAFGRPAGGGHAGRRRSEGRTGGWRLRSDDGNRQYADEVGRAAASETSTWARSVQTRGHGAVRWGTTTST